MTIEITPIGKPRINRAFWSPQAQKYFAWRDCVRVLMPDYELPGQLTLMFFMPMPPSWSERKRMSLIGAPHQQKPDIDNLIKAFMDCFGSDEHVYQVTATKLWSEAGFIDVA